MHVCICFLFPPFFFLLSFIIRNDAKLYVIEFKPYKLDTSNHCVDMIELVLMQSFSVFKMLERKKDSFLNFYSQIRCIDFSKLY